MVIEYLRASGAWARFAALALVLVGSTACVYFNTFYNAQKYFAQAEKARREDRKAASAQEAESEVQLSPKTKQLYDKAAKKASRVLEKFPQSDRIDDALFMLGKAFYWQQDFLSAARSFADLEKSFPHSEYYERSRYWRAMCLEGEGRYDAARALYQELVSGTDPSVAARAGLRIGEMAFEHKDFVAAAEEFRTTADAFPRSRVAPELWLRLGESLFALQDSTRYDGALEAFERVTHLHASTGTEYRARLNIGRVLQAQGREQEALEWYTDLLKKGRFRAFEGQTRILIGRYYQKRGDLDAALEQYVQVRDDFPQTPSSAMALYQTGLLYLRGYGDEERAREYLQEVGREQGASEAARLAREMLGYLQEMSRLRARVTRADSLAAVRLAARAAAAADSVAQDSVVDSPGSVPDSVDVASTGGESGSPSGAGSAAEAGPSRPPVIAADAQRDVVRRQRDALLEDLLAAAELYRDPQRIAVADSAIYYLQEVLRRFPDFEQKPRVLYTIAWIHLQLQHDQQAARPLLEQLISAYPKSEYANAARRELGLPVAATAAEAAAAEFRRIEEIRLRDPRLVPAYVPLLDSLSARYPATEAGAQAAYVAAYTMENVAGDSMAAARRFASVEERFPRTKYARLVAARDSMLQHGLLAKLERGIKSVGGGGLPGERITVLAAEPDSMDSLSRARRYYALALRAQRRGDLRVARQNYELSLQERANQPEVHYHLGNVLDEQGYMDDAVAQYREALTQRPNMLEVQYRLLAAHIQRGRVDSASFYLRAIMQRDPRNPQIELLREQHPDLVKGDSAEPLDLATLEDLHLAPPDEELEIRPDGILQELPVVRQPVLPPPPPALADTAWAILDLLVDKDGSVAQVDVFSAADSLRDAAVAAARRYTFFPALDRRGEPVSVWVELELPFLPRTGVHVAQVAASSTSDSSKSIVAPAEP